MTQSLTIKNYKSIKKMDIECKKVNVFIGEPNSGKSNIIEAMALQSQNVFFNELNHEVIRYKTMTELFYDNNIHLPIEVKTTELSSRLEFPKGPNGGPLNRFDFYLNYPINSKNCNQLDFSGKINTYGDNGTTRVKYYAYKRLDSFFPSQLSYLSAPSGDNLPGLILSNPELKAWVSDLFRSFGYKLMIRPLENEISMSKEVNNELYDYRYQTISETIQRLVFYSLAIKSNENSILLFDEPESNMFPFYIKDFAERMAEDETNQFFITTHNPYLLGSLLDKCKKDNINIFITKMEAYETKVSQCSQDQIEELISLGSGSFLSLDNILNESTH